MVGGDGWYNDRRSLSQLHPLGLGEHPQPAGFVDRVGPRIPEPPDLDVAERPRRIRGRGGGRAATARPLCLGQAPAIVRDLRQSVVERRGRLAGGFRTSSSAFIASTSAPSLTSYVTLGSLSTRSVIGFSGRISGGKTGWDSLAGPLSHSLRGGKDPMDIKSALRQP